MPRLGRCLWELRGITKEFPGVRANDNISIKLYPGEIHGLLGENGSGKSTLIKIISGVQQPDAGTILFKGQQIHLANPTDARQNGVATVFQEFSLVSTLTVAENIFLGRQPRKRLRTIDWKRVGRRSIIRRCSHVSPTPRSATVNPCGYRGRPPCSTTRGSSR